MANRTPAGRGLAATSNGKPALSTRPEDVDALALLTGIAVAGYVMYRDIYDRPPERELAHREALLRSAAAGVVAGLATRLAGDTIRSVLLVTDRSEDIHDALATSNVAVQSVERAIREMDRSTTRLQKLAIYVAIGTALAGAVIGGFAGAWAARVIGS
jgi:hypothetical protein